MHRLKFVLAGLLCASPALAQDAPVEGEPMPDPEADMNAGGGAGAEVGDGSMAATVDGTVGIGHVRAVVDRNYVVGKGKIGAYANYGILKFSFFEPITMTTFSGTGDGFGVGAGYGVTDTITVGGQYGFTPGIIGDADSELKGSLDIFGNIQLVNDGKLNVTANADFDLDLCGANDPMTGDCSATKAIHAGLGARYKLAPQMAVFTGAPYGPGPIGQHLSISLESSGPITFDVPVGFMYQATPELNVHLMTNLATIAISNAGDSAFFGADFIPVTLGGLFSLNQNLDLAAQFILPDMKEAQFDLYAFSIGARYYN